MLVFLYKLCYSKNMNLNKYQLERVIEPTVAPLERALVRQNLHSTVESLQLRDTVCGFATGALQKYLDEVHGIQTDRILTTPDEAPRGMSSRKLTHVALRHNDYIIDPTYGQFMQFVGLDPRTASEHGYEELYPEPKVAIYDIDEWRSFADSMADHAYHLDQFAGIKKPDIELPPFGALRGASLDDMKHAYRAVWNPAGYEEFAVTSQPQHFQDAVSSLAGSIPRP